jgi:hypothetical protein
MTQIQTSLRSTRESARRLRFEPTGVLTQTNVQKAIEQAAAHPLAINQTIISFVQSPYTAMVTDTFLSVDTSGGPISIILPGASTRNGVPLTVKDATGRANTNNITVTFTGGELCDGQNAVVIDNSYGWETTTPSAGGGAWLRS